MTDTHQRTFIYRFHWRDELWHTAFVKCHGTTIVAAPKLLQEIVGRNIGEVICEMRKRYDTLTVRTTKLAIGT